MADIDRVLATVRDWKQPRRGAGKPFRLTCWLDAPVGSGEVAESWKSAAIPVDLLAFWSKARSARLFVDADYGQWGLALLSPARSAARTARERSARPDDIRSGDVVVGEFLGDQELVVLAGDSGGKVLIALPLDRRDDWYQAAATLGEFRDAYVRFEGAKFWESAQA